MLSEARGMEKGFLGIWKVRWDQIHRLDDGQFFTVEFKLKN